MWLKVLNATWVEAAEVDIQECVHLPSAMWRAGAGPTPLLCFAVVEATVMPMQEHPCLLVLLHSSS